MLVEQNSPKLHNFIASHSRSYPSNFPYRTDTDHPLQTASSTEKFRTARRSLMTELLLYRQARHEMAKSLALEYLVQLALQPLFSGSGFEIQCAPQSLECSNHTQKGVDLIICDTTGVVLLGIDVKQRKGNSIYERDGYGWNQQLLAPYIYLSLGNLQITTREQTTVSIIDWLIHYVLNHITDSGKIPHFNPFRDYLLQRIEKSLNGLTERCRESDIFTFSTGLPDENSEAFTIMERKISITQSVFIEFIQNNTL